MKKRVVITGMGAVTSVGIGVQDFWRGILEGESGVGNISLFDAQNYEVRIAAEVKNFNPTDFITPEIYRKTDRFAQFGVAAAKMAMDDAGIEPAYDKSNNNIGVIIGSGLGGNLFHEEQIFKLIENNEPRRVLSSSVPRIAPNAVSAYIAIQYKFRGPNMTISTACSSGANAIAVASRLIEDGICDTVITGGVECPITPFTFAAYQSLRVLAKPGSHNVPRPFDKLRDGFVLGEAGGVLILEEYKKAKKRNAKTYAELVGYASNCGAYHMAAPDPSGDDAAEAIRQALKRANVKPEKVDYVNAHGTATKLNDLCESKAIETVFGVGADAPLVGSTKASTGHTIGAAGAIEAIISALSVHADLIPPSINCEEPDGECHVNIAPPAVTEKKVEYAVSNSFGFGSNNSVLVFRKVQ